MTAAKGLSTAYTLTDADGIDRGSQWCEIGDTIRSWCAHCRTPDLFKQSHKAEARQRERKREPSKLGRWFRAAYAGECSRCDAPFEAGEDIRADYPSGWIRKACHAGARARREGA